ncbi:MAG: hypothetical protein IKI50_03850 [Clostridia bacterium]|nr:hypothetical protein [Clostridia bacterium]
MRKRMGAVLVALIFALLAVLPASADTAQYKTYTYDSLGQERFSPHAYLPATQIWLNGTDAGALVGPSDVVAAPDGAIYIADTGNNRVVVLHADYTLRGVITQVDDVNGLLPDVIVEGEDGESENLGPMLGLNAPEGVFVTANGLLYIADTGNGRILVCDTQGQLIKEIGAPVSSALPEDFIFAPTALAVDEFGRLYVISKNMNMGVITLTEQGVFDGFIGVQRVVPDLMALFWRRFQTEEQIARTTQFVPTEYNNISIDADGFLYVTTNTIDQWPQYSALLSRSSAGDYAPIRRLNASGDDILRRTGTYPPAGDLVIDGAPSSIVDAAAGPSGIYTMLDVRKSRFFTYDEKGNLLYIFGGTPMEGAASEQLVSLTYQGNRMLCLDKTSGGIMVYEPTPYGLAIQNALQLYRERRYTQASEAWAALSEQNNNLDIAQKNLGNIAYQNGDYAEAMKHYRIVGDLQSYSNAFAESRKEWVNSWFLLIPLAIVAIVMVLRLAILAGGRSVAAVDAGTKKNNIGRQLLFSFRTLMHPFSAYDEIKRSGRVGVGAATCLLGAALLAVISRQLFTGFHFAGGEPGLHIFEALATIVLPLLLFCVSNWCFSTLTDGKGRFSDIYVTCCVSLLPLILTLPMAAILSNMLTLDETGIYQFITAIGMIWFVFSLFCGILVTHDYGFGKTVLTLVLTLLGMVIILFLTILFLNLISQIIGFIRNLGVEISAR